MIQNQPNFPFASGFRRRLDIWLYCGGNSGHKFQSGIACYYLSLSVFGILFPQQKEKDNNSFRLTVSKAKKQKQNKKQKQETTDWTRNTEQTMNNVEQQVVVEECCNRNDIKTTYNSKVTFTMVLNKRCGPWLLIINQQ